MSLKEYLQLHVYRWSEIASVVLLWWMVCFLGINSPTSFSVVHTRGSEILAILAVILKNKNFSIVSILHLYLRYCMCYNVVLSAISRRAYIMLIRYVSTFVDFSAQLITRILFLLNIVIQSWYFIRYSGIEVIILHIPSDLLYATSLIYHSGGASLLHPDCGVISIYCRQAYYFFTCHIYLLLYRPP